MKLVAIFPLLAVWLVLAGNVRASTLIAGIVLCAAAVVIFANLATEHTVRGGRGPDAGEQPASVGLWPFVRRMLWALVFIPVFLGKVLLSGLTMAFLALKPSIDFWPGIVRVRGGFRSLTTTAIFANAMTLTPGTLTVDYDEKTDDLYVHWIDVTGYEDDFDHRVTSGMRVWMERLER